MSGGIQVIVSKSIIVDHNPLVVCCGICKDTIVPLGLDNRLPEDTLFMIFEEDFRFFPEGQDPDGADDYSERVMQLIMERGFEALKGSESLPPQSQNSSSSKDKQQGSESLPPQSQSKSSSQGKSSGKGSKPKPESRFFSTASRESSDLKDEENEGFSSNVADLVRWATVAHRHKMGNLIWVGWCPEKDKTSRLSNGSHLIMVSRTGLSHIAKALHKQEIESGHIDLVLKKWLSKGNTAEKVQACYVWPSMGGYTAHESGCDPFNFGAAQGGRSSNWDKQKPAIGTRVATDPKQRGKWLIQWAEASANRVWKHCPDDSELVQAKFLWKSIREPTASVPIREPTASDPSGSTQGTQQQEAKEDTENPEGAPPRSKRYKRLRRQFEMREEYRHWTTTIEEAAVVK